ncbi:serine dehydratase alpha chain-domain-containing protein [Armillaria borealis]|uniref:Serine dehydratase alpha chain-domain-containing protein n=1 Tax=Armillaria borealis TaxID=47425 RepID=A0AA39JRQ1_9AGAR|nr:serine dehydratase alpha chain-domain-containing protein [Armillaria borealis]
MFRLVLPRLARRRPFCPSRPQFSTKLIVPEIPQHPEHAVISAFDLFSIGVGPSSSHTVGPMRAGKIFINDLKELQLLEKVKTVKITLYGSLAATGKGHHTPQAILLGLEGSDPETIDTGTIPSRYDSILTSKSLYLGGHHRIHYDTDHDMLWRWDQVLKTHPNGMRFSCFGEDGDLLATNEYFRCVGYLSVRKLFIFILVSEAALLLTKKPKWTRIYFTRVSINESFKLQDYIKRTPCRNPIPKQKPPSSPEDTPGVSDHPPYPFTSGNSLLALTKNHNMTIAQIVYDNEKSFGYTENDIHDKIFRIWQVMDDCIRAGVSAVDPTLPGRLGLRRRAPMLYKRLMRGFYSGVASPTLPAIGSGRPSDDVQAIDSPDYTEEMKDDTLNRPLSGPSKITRRTKATRVVGSFDHPLLPMPPRKTTIPAMDFLSCYAIAVNEVNASGGRIVTSPTNGAAGVIPAVLKYILEFISDDPEKSIMTFLLTAAAIGMLFKRGSTISAAEGGCQAEVGVACSMASAGFAACMGATPETVLQAAEIGIEHNLGLTCDPIDGLVQVPCIERNSLGAVKAITAAQLSMASQGVYSVTLDEAIEAMRITAADMSVKYKETSLSGLAVSDVLESLKDVNLTVAHVDYRQDPINGPGLLTGYRCSRCYNARSSPDSFLECMAGQSTTDFGL